MAGMENKDLTLDFLASSIRQLHEQLSNSAKHAVNVALTLRNWLIGYYIAEYELHGADRAKYGEQLILQLAGMLNDLPNCRKRQLYEYLTFYRTWPQIVPAASALWVSIDDSSQLPAKLPTVSALLHGTDNSLLTKLSFSMFKELL